MTGNNRVDQKFYAPVAQPGAFGAWRVVIFNPGEGGGERIERFIVAASLVPIVEHYGTSMMEAEYLGEGECLMDVSGFKRETEATEEA
jgi:hypothetical protein